MAIGIGAGRVGHRAQHPVRHGERGHHLADVLGGPEQRRHPGGRGQARAAPLLQLPGRQPRGVPAHQCLHGRQRVLRGHDHGGPRGRQPGRGEPAAGRVLGGVEHRPLHLGLRVEDEHRPVAALAGRLRPRRRHHDARVRWHAVDHVPGVAGHHRHAREGTADLLGRAVGADADGPQAPPPALGARPVRREGTAPRALRDGGGSGDAQGPAAGAVRHGAAPLAGDDGNVAATGHLHEDRPRRQRRAGRGPRPVRDPRGSGGGIAGGVVARQRPDHRRAGRERRPGGLHRARPPGLHPLLGDDRPGR